MTMAKKNSKKAKGALFVPPVIEHSEWDETPERIPLFSISTPNPDGGEPSVVEYDMPGRANVGLSLAFLRMIRTSGGEVALAWLLEECVGTEGFLALCSQPDLTQDELRAISTRARDVVLGRVEAPKD